MFYNWLLRRKFQFHEAEACKCHWSQLYSRWRPTWSKERTELVGFRFGTLEGSQSRMGHGEFSQWQVSGKWIFIYIQSWWITLHWCISQYITTRRFSNAVESVIWFASLGLGRLQFLFISVISSYDYFSTAVPCALPTTTIIAQSEFLIFRNSRLRRRLLSIPKWK